MSFLTKLFGRGSVDPDNPENLTKPYGEVILSHLAPGCYDVHELGIFDPDLLKIAITKFIDHHPGIVESVRVATYPSKQMNSHFIMIQDEFSTDPDRWFCVAPLKNPEK